MGLADTHETLGLNIVDTNYGVKIEDCTWLMIVDSSPRKKEPYQHETSELITQDF